MKKNIPTFNLLSIGPRGVGKSVFLAGTYADVRSGRQASSSDIRFEGGDDKTKETLENLLDYIERTGQYPPPTMQVTGFTFKGTSPRRHNRTLCNFRWADVPGEVCRLDNRAFEAMLLDSHGCCVFIDALALVQDPNYQVQLDEVAEQLEVMASLATQSGLRYLFALILTKCDDLPAGSTTLIQIEQKFRKLTMRLDEAHAIYRQFYSSVSIISSGKRSVAVSKNTSAPLSWMLSELYKASRSRRKPAKLGRGSEEALVNVRLPKYSRRSTHLWPKVLASMGIVAVGMGVWFGTSQVQTKIGQALSLSPPTQEQAFARELAKYERKLKKAPEDADVLSKLVGLHQEQGQHESSLEYLEQLIALQPENLNLYLSKAGLYAAMGLKEQEEAAYDEVLVLQEDNVAALTNKAILRSTQGDLETARYLFSRAEAVATDGELKKTVQDAAQNMLSAAGQ